jgi:hypothetical protein
LSNKLVTPSTGTATEALVAIKTQPSVVVTFGVAPDNEVG